MRVPLAQHVDRMPWCPRCQATYPGDPALQCERPAGHDVGPHLAAGAPRWDDDLFTLAGGWDTWQDYDEDPPRTRKIPSKIF